MSGYIYAIQVGDNGPVKIGYSESPRTRLIALQTSHYDELVLRFEAPGTRADEKFLHGYLVAHRIRNEWFRPHDDVWAALKEPFCQDRALVEIEQSLMLAAWKARGGNEADYAIAFAEVGRQFYREIRRIAAEKHWADAA